MKWLRKIVSTISGGNAEREVTPPPLPTDSKPPLTPATPTNRLAPVATVKAPEQHAATSTSRLADKPQGIAIDKLRWVGQRQFIKLGVIGDMRNPMIYLGDSRQMPILPPEVVDLARSVKDEGDLPALSRTPAYGQMPSRHRLEYLRWIAAGRRIAPPTIAYADLFLAGLERRALIDGRDTLQIFDELLGLVSVIQRAPLAEAHSFCAQATDLLWYLVVLDPARFDVTHLRMLVYAMPLRSSEVVGAMLGWFWATNTELPSWAAIIAARMHEQAKPFAGDAGPTSSVFSRFDAFFSPAYRHILRSAIGPEHRFEYRALNPAVGTRKCSAVNPWKDQRRLHYLARCWNEAIAPRLKAPVANSEPPVESRREQLATFITERVLSEQREPLRPPAVHTPASPPPLPRRGLLWFGSGEPLNVPGAGTIPNSMCYLFVPDGKVNPEPAAITPGGPVAASPYRASGQRELDYWPRYNDLSAGQRRYYLDWLAAGRSTPPHELGYTFLFIYGLERRALLEQCDIPSVFDEVIRLKAMYASSSLPSSRSFDSYTDSLLWFLAVRNHDLISEQRIHTLCAATASWSDEALAALLTWHALCAKRIDGDIAFKLAAHLPDSIQSVVVHRVGKEMKQLFSARFAERFPEGFELRNSKRDRTYAYRPASASLSSVEVTRCSPWGLQSQFKPLLGIWNECVEDLRKLSSVRRSGEGELTPEAWAALPPELRRGRDHPLLARFVGFVSAHTTESGQVHVTAGDLAQSVNGETATRLTPANARRLAEIVADLGYGIEPDPRITGKGYDAGDRIAIFQDSANSETQADLYSIAACMLSVGIALAGADGHVHADELAHLNQQILTSFELNESEVRRLAARRDLLLATGVDVSSVGATLRKLDAAHRALMGRLILSVVAADGVISDDELKALRKLFTILGYSKPETEQAIRSLTVTPDATDEPVEVAAGVEAERGEVIPAPPSPAVPTLRLDRMAIAAIMKDTHEVAQMLAEAMNLETAEVMVDVSAQPAHTPDSSPSLDPSVPTRYTAFYQVVVTKTSWSQSELAALAKRHGLMLSGAVEAINEWSTEKHGGPLLYDDGATFTLEAAYLN